MSLSNLWQAIFTIVLYALANVLAITYSNRPTFREQFIKIQKLTCDIIVNPPPFQRTHVLIAQSVTLSLIFLPQARLSVPSASCPARRFWSVRFLSSLLASQSQLVRRVRLLQVAVRLDPEVRVAVVDNPAVDAVVDAVVVDVLEAARLVRYVQPYNDEKYRS